MNEQPAGSITCPKCGFTSHNPSDVREQYCGACHTFFRDSAIFMLATMRPQDLQLADRYSYHFVRVLADGSFIAVMRLVMGGGQLNYSDTRGDVEDLWQYEDFYLAIVAAASWNRGEQPEPFGWYRHPVTGRRRALGNPRSEYNPDAYPSNQSLGSRP
jgi:hypothetical protein